MTESAQWCVFIGLLGLIFGSSAATKYASVALAAAGLAALAWRGVP